MNAFSGFMVKGVEAKPSLSGKVPHDAGRQTAEGRGRSNFPDERCVVPDSSRQLLKRHLSLLG